MRRGLLAEYDDPEALLEAIRRVRALGCRRLDTYTPWPVKGLDEALDLPRSPLPRYVLAAGLLGAALAWAIQWFTNAFDYPLVVGARPPHAAPAFVLITFETTVLLASLTAFGAVLVLSGLPRPWSAEFEVDGFERASIDRFWLGIDAEDEHYDERRLIDELRQSGAIRMVELREESRP